MSIVSHLWETSRQLEDLLARRPHPLRDVATIGIDVAVVHIIG
jgi:hypothetical protein